MNLAAIIFGIFLSISQISFARFSVSNMVLASSLPHIRNKNLNNEKVKPQVLSKDSDYCSLIEAASVATKAKDAAITPKVSKSLVARLGPILASAFCVAAIMYPLDLVRALQMANAGSGMQLTTAQLLSDFQKAHGFSGFFTQGLVPELARSTWMRFVKFSLFPMIHLAITHGIEESKGTSATKALAAILASIPEAMSIMPLEIAKISLQLDKSNRFNNNMFTAMGTLFQEKGIQVFSVGYLGIQFRQALWSTGYFVTLPLFQKQIEKGIQCIAGPEYKIKDHPAVNTFTTVFAGFLAGVFGAALNTPSDTIRSTMQKNYLASTNAAAASTITLLGVGKDIVKARGVQGLYAGFQFKSFHLGGGGALMAFFLPFFQNVFKDVK